MDVKKVVTEAILISTLFYSGIASSQAQEAERAADTRVEAAQTQAYERNDDGFPWGLLGLLGLFGLIPRKNKDFAMHRDVPNTATRT